jgi:hypothetical protein
VEEHDARIAPAIIIHEPPSWARATHSPASSAALVMIGAFLLAFVAFALATF